MVKKSSHLRNYHAVAHSNGSHQLHFSIQTANLLLKVLKNTQSPQDIGTRTTLENLIKKELTQTFVHKKVANNNISEKSISKIRWKESEKVNKIFTILYQDYNHPIMTPQINKIWNVIETYTKWKELEWQHPLPRLLQGKDDYTPQSLDDILATIRRIKKQRSLLSAVKTEKIYLNTLLHQPIDKDTLDQKTKVSITDIATIQDQKTYKCNIFSDFTENKTANRILNSLWDSIQTTLPWFTKTNNMHVTWQFYNKAKWKSILKKHLKLVWYIKSYTTPTHEFHNHTFHKAHVWTSHVNQKKYLLLIPHEDNIFTKMVLHWFTPHISLGTYEWHLSDEEILWVLKNCKDQLFAYNNTNLFHITPDQILKIKCTEKSE